MSDSGQVTRHQSQHTKPLLATDYLQQEPRHLSDHHFVHSDSPSDGVISSDQSIPVLRDGSISREQSFEHVLKPFYSIISDTTVCSSSAETYYPLVRYLFTDDDPNLLTDTFGSQHSQNWSETSRDANKQRVPSRPILVDLELSPDALKYRIACATSLSTDWAVTDAQLQSLRTSPSNDSPDSDGDHLMMLRIEGFGQPASDSANTDEAAMLSPSLQKGEQFLSRDERMPRYDIECSDLVSSFERRMAVLQRVAHSSDGNKEQ